MLLAILQAGAEVEAAIQRHRDSINDAMLQVCVGGWVGLEGWRCHWRGRAGSGGQGCCDPPHNVVASSAAAAGRWGRDGVAQAVTWWAVSVPWTLPLAWLLSWPPAPWLPRVQLLQRRIETARDLEQELGVVEGLQLLYRRCAPGGTAAWGTAARGYCITGAHLGVLQRGSVGDGLTALLGVDDAS